MTTPTTGKVDALTVAAALGISRSSVYNLTRRTHDPLPAYRFANAVRFSLAEVRAWEKRQAIP